MLSISFTSVLTRQLYIPNLLQISLRVKISILRWNFPCHVFHSLVSCTNIQDHQDTISKLLDKVKLSASVGVSPQNSLSTIQAQPQKTATYKQNKEVTEKAKYVALLEDVKFILVICL